MLTFPWPAKMPSVTSCEYMDRQWKTCLPKYQWWPQILPHPNFSSKLFPKSGVTYSSTRKAMALPLLNSLHCFKIHDHVILIVKSSMPKASLSFVTALTEVPSFVYQSNQSAADRVEDNGPSEKIGYLLHKKGYLPTEILGHYYNVTIKGSLCIQVGNPSTWLPLLQLSQK